MPLNFTSLSDPALERRFQSGLGEELAQRATRRLAVARQPLARQEGGANVGNLRGPVQRGGVLGDRARAQAGLATALADTVSRQGGVALREEGAARQKFLAARAQEIARQKDAIAGLVGSIAKTGVFAGRAGQAIAERETDKKQGAVADKRQDETVELLKRILGGS